MNDTTRLLPLQLLNQESLDFSTYCLSSFGSGYLKFSLDFNLFALCVWEKQIQPTRPMLTSCQASLGQSQLCYWSSEVDCTFGRYMRRRWRLEEAGSPSRPTYLSFFTGLLTSFLLLNVPAEGLMGVAIVFVHSCGRGYRFPRLRFKPLCLSLRCKITRGWWWQHSVCSQQETLESSNKVRAGPCAFPGLSLPGLGLSYLVTDDSFPTSSLTLSRQSTV